ncbi:MAG: Holliday junction resolvase RuvX [Candidatus Marinimicrobia bacterium]|nr:Holliday junction resolvase RuvX [Candidatus Neomarinimicrobiota bacterium]
MNRILAIDYGDVRVGLALSDLTCTIAQPFKTLNYDDMNHLINQLSEIITEKQVNKVVVGIPYNMKGDDTQQTTKVREFVSILEQKLGYEIIFVDERLTSSEAEKFMHQMDIKTGFNKDKIDKIAASIILQEYIDTI